jgi:hypothetical protein
MTEAEIDRVIFNILCRYSTEITGEHFENTLSQERQGSDRDSNRALPNANFALLLFHIIQSHCPNYTSY